MTDVGHGQIGSVAQGMQTGPIAPATSKDRPRQAPFSALWNRTLDGYPEDRSRFRYLAIVVVAAIILYYEFYVGAAVAPDITAHYGMSFPFYVYLVVVANLVGAFASLVAGLADRWGRANLVVYGLLLTGLLVLVGLPNAPNMWVFAGLYGLLGFVEGVILVATPALVRDFSPQLGRASAMAFWTMGPVIGALAVSMVSSHTLGHLHAWQDQFIICGVVGLVVFAIALFGLRELSPQLRDQLMVSTRDRALIEARASGIDIEAGIRHPWRQMLRFDIVAPAVGIGVFLVVYYTMIAFLPTYMATIFGYSLQRANALGNWIWVANAAALVIAGVLSDRLRVRKPLMVVGCAGAVAATVLWALRTDQPTTGYYTFVAIASLMAVCLAVVFATWMAAFTETVEKRNPALMATGLAVWGWVLRMVVAGSLFVLPYIVTTMTPLLTYGPKTQALANRYAAEIVTVGALDPATLARLSVDPGNQAALGQAVTQISTRLHVSPATAVDRLIAVSKVPKADLAYLQEHGPTVSSAAKTSPGEWRTWWWACVASEAVLLPTIFLMTGRWSPNRARKDAEDHERRLTDEMIRLGLSSPLVRDAA